MKRKGKRRECDRCTSSPEFLFESFFDKEFLCRECADDEKGCPNFGRPEFKGAHGTEQDLAHLIGEMGKRRGGGW